jgi:hypothetical protein
MRSELPRGRAAEPIVRGLFEKEYKAVCPNARLSVGRNGETHSFDLFHESAFVGEITSGTWKNDSGTSNTGAQDRALAALLWLSLYSGEEKRFLIVTCEDMYSNLIRRVSGALFQNSITVLLTTDGKTFKKSTKLRST